MGRLFCEKIPHELRPEGELEPACHRGRLECYLHSGRTLDHWIPDGRDVRLVWLGGVGRRTGVWVKGPEGPGRGESVEHRLSKGALKGALLQRQM